MASSGPPTTCNYCFAPLRWLRTAKNDVLMPVDADPDPVRGNVIVISGKAGVLNAGQARGARASGKQLYLHHAATCPHADQWRSTGTPARSGPSTSRRR